MSESLKYGYLHWPKVSVKRYCQFLSIHPEKVEEYIHAHRHIWKEIPEGIQKAGILDMELYILGNQVVMILETPVDFDWDVAFGKLATFERQAEWEAYVAQFQQVDAGLRSDEKWQLMERIFSLEQAP